MFVATNRPAETVTVDDVLSEALAEEDLGLTRIDGVRNEADHVERELREGAAHLVEAVLGLDDDLVEAVVDGPDFLLLGEGSKVALTAPVLSGAADPLIEHSPAVELDDIFELHHEVGELRLGFVCLELVSDLERDGHNGGRIVGQRRLGHQDLVIAIGEAAHDLSRTLFAREVEEKLFDVLNFERALVKAVLADEIFHGS